MTSETDRNRRSFELVKRVGEWSLQNFGAEQRSKADPEVELRAIAPLVGLVEEYCEYSRAMSDYLMKQDSDTSEMEDAIGDMGVYLCDALYRTFDFKDHNFYGVVFAKEPDRMLLDQVSDEERFVLFIQESSALANQLLPILEYGMLLANEQLRELVIGEAPGGAEMLFSRFLGVVLLFTQSLSLVSYLALGRDLLEVVEGVFNGVVAKRNWKVQPRGA